MSVVVGYVPTAEGKAALRKGIEEARLRSVGVVVVNSSRGDALVDERYLDESGLAALSAELVASGLQHHIWHEVRGRDIVEELRAAIEAHDGQLVVIGLRRRSAVGKIILGSAASRILLGAPCPVLTVKA